MDRREFLRNAAGVGGITLVGGAFWAKHAYSTLQLEKRLMADVSPVLTDKAHSEFQVLPVKGREEIRQWFHGRCLNVRPFVNEVCANRFREKLHALPTKDDQHRLLMVAFCGKVVTDSEILNRVQTIAEEAGQELDLNWGKCCKSIANNWNLHMTDYSQPVEMTEFIGRVDGLVKLHLDEALEAARVGALNPTFGETSGKIGRSALSLFPYTRVKVNALLGQLDANPVALILALPTFVFVALEHLAQFIVGLLSDPRADLQSHISARLALLGNRIGDEFASEIRKQLGVLHGWQERSLRIAAQQYSAAAVGWL